MEPQEYEEAVRLYLEAEVNREGQQHSEFRPQKVVCERSYPWTRLMVYFTRDDIPDVLLGFWTAIWQWVAWDELHLKARAVRTHPGALAGSFNIAMSDYLFPNRGELPYGYEVEISRDPVVRLIRLPLVW